MTGGARGDAIVGVWSLDDYTDRAAEPDPWGHTFGVNPIGRIIYHPSGVLSVQIIAGAEPSIAPYLGYFGHFVVREAVETPNGIEGIVEHHIEATTHPEWLDDGVDRPFLVAGNELTLGDRLTSVRHFVRLD